MGNTNMHQARANRNDEFFTQLSDIENEMKHYRKHFEGKNIYMNCDNPEESNFWQFFYLNFEFLGLRKIISTFYDESEPVYKLEYNGTGEPIKTPLTGNGDFRSPEAVELLKEADIVITNPPFSLFREYVAQLIEYEKDFIIMGNNNAITYREIFPLIKSEKIWLGHNANKTMEFRIPDCYERWDRVDEDGNKYGKVPAISWFTNLDLPKRHEDILLFRTYYGNEEDYPTYDNYDAIEVNRVNNIPMDYDGVMGVPITFLTRYNPDQFEIVGITDRANTSGLRTKIYTKKDSSKYSDLNARSVILQNNGEYKAIYARILIKRKDD